MTLEERKEHQKNEETLHASNLSGPRRPTWNAKMTVEELDDSERHDFLVWRCSVARNTSDLETLTTTTIVPVDLNAFFLKMVTFGV
nr:GTPase LSG1-2-like [Tanacetum cinerariifolium]